MIELQSRKGWSSALSRLVTLLVSIVLALAIWLYVNNLENPMQSKDLRRIPVTVYGLAANLLPIQDLSKEYVSITVRAPEKTWDYLTAEDFSAHIDLTNKGIGTHTEPIIVTSTNPQATVLDIRQPSLTIQLDKYGRKEMPIQVELVDRVAVGFEAKTPIVDPPTVTVSGPQTQVDLVSDVLASIYTENAKSQVERTQTLSALNRQHRVVSGVTIEPNAATVTIPIENKRGLKTVAVRLTLVGQPAYGYRLSTVKVEPSTVILQGDPQVIDEAPGFVETEPLDLTNVNSEINKQIAINPPAGTTIMDGATVSVRVSIASLEDSRTIKAQLLVNNLGKGYEVTKELDVVDVIISGPLTLVDGVSRDDVFARLDLTNLLPGTHTITPIVVLPDGVRSEGVLPESVEVVIIDKSTPTPAPNELVSPNDGLTTTLPASATTTITATKVSASE